MDHEMEQVQTTSLAKREQHSSALMPLEKLEASVEGYSGRILLRIPRSLHKRLAEAAKVEGVSLNQYALYRLSREP